MFRRSGSLPLQHETSTVVFIANTTQMFTVIAIIKRNDVGRISCARMSHKGSLFRVRKNSMQVTLK